MVYCVTAYLELSVPTSLQAIVNAIAAQVQSPTWGDVVVISEVSRRGNPVVHVIVRFYQQVSAIQLYTFITRLAEHLPLLSGLVGRHGCYHDVYDNRKACEPPIEEYRR